MEDKKYICVFTDEKLAKKLEAYRKSNPEELFSVMVMENKTSPIFKLLGELGVPQNRIGYTYISEALDIMLNCGEDYGILTKIIYPKIARKHKKTTQSIERAVRIAFDIMWREGDASAISRLFDNDKWPNIRTLGRKPKPIELFSAMHDELTKRMFENPGDFCL